MRLLLKMMNNLLGLEMATVLRFAVITSFGVMIRTGATLDGAGQVGISAVGWVLGVVYKIVGLLVLTKD